MRVQLSFQTTLKPQIIVDSFHKCGTNPINFDVILNALRGTTVSNDERYHLEEVAQDLVDCISEKGQIAEADFDNFLIREDAHQKAKGILRDERIISQRRSLILTHPAFAEKEWALDIEEELEGEVVEFIPTELPEKRMRTPSAKVRENSL